MTIRKLLKNTRRATVYFRKLRKYCHGTCECSENDGTLKDWAISIDLRKQTNPARVFLHELLHMTYPEKSEHAIMKSERHMWTRASQGERYLLYRTLFLRKWRTEIF